MKPEDFLLMTEAQIMGYGESDTSGCWIKLQLTSEDLIKVRGKKGVACEFTLRELDHMTGEAKDSSSAVSKTEAVQKGGNLCCDAVMMCKNENFQRYISSFGPPCYGRPNAEAIAKSFMLVKCGIKSRVELDHSDEAEKKFTSVCKAYSQFVNRGIYNA